MTREEEILNAAREYNNGITFASPSNVLHFEAGAKWADESPNFENIWHDSSEEPKDCSEILIYFLNEYGKMACRLYQYIYWSELTWRDVIDLYHIKRWAYINDFLPKGEEE